MQANILLDELYQRAEAILDVAVREWQNLPPEKLTLEPAPGRWSAAQCLAHLNAYGRYYLPAIDQALQQARTQGMKPAATFRSSWLGAYFTRLMQPESKTKLKAPANAIPPRVVNPTETLAQFIEQQEYLLQLIEQARQADLNRVRIPISILPWIRLKLGDTFGFYVAHHQRHVAQAKRALSGE